MHRICTASPLILTCLLISTAARGQNAADPPPESAPPTSNPAPGPDDSTAGDPAADDDAEGDTEAIPPLDKTLTGLARAEYEAARILYQDGDYQGALNKLQVAYEKSNDPRLLWNMAAAHKNLRHYARVMELIDEYLAAGAPYVTASDEAQARALVDTVSGFVSEVTVRAKPEGATVSVDGERVGTVPLAAPLMLDFGRRAFTVTNPGYVPYRQELELKGGEKRALDVALVREVNEGQLKIISDSSATIRVDGKVVGVGLWEGRLPTGTHTVQIDAKGKVPSTTEVVVAKGQSRVVNQPLRDEVVQKKRVPAWAWITGGVVTAAAVGAGTYFAVRGGDEAPPPQPGTWNTLEF